MNLCRRTLIAYTHAGVPPQLASLSERLVQLSQRYPHKRLRVMYMYKHVRERIGDAEPQFSLFADGSCAQALWRLPNGFVHMCVTDKDAVGVVRDKAGRWCWVLH
jgi:hypothetical protein